MNKAKKSCPESSISPDFARSTAIYNASARNSADNYQAAHWGSPLSQTRRFAILAEGWGGRLFCNASVLDVGCGSGDFCRYLEAAGLSPAQYLGIDLSSEMIARAKGQSPSLDFREWNILEQDIGVFDIVVASGIFTFLDGKREERMRQLISAMYTACRKALFFNSLSSWSTEQAQGEFYANPLDACAFCHTLTPWLVMRHDYHPGDFTIYMYRNRQE